MNKLGHFVNIPFNICESLFNVKDLLFEVTNRGRISIDWIFMKISRLQVNGESGYIFWMLLWISVAIFLTAVFFWKYGRIPDASQTLKKYVYEVHQTAGSLNPSAESMKNCIHILNQFPSLINHPRPPYNYTPFLRACWSGNSALIRHMLLNGADINSCTVCKESPIYLAAYRIVKMKKWNPSFLDLLYNAGCPLSLPNVKGITALHYAANAGHVSLTRWLLMHGAHLALPFCKITPFDLAFRIRDTNHQSVAALLHIYCPEMAEKGRRKLSQE